MSRVPYLLALSLLACAHGPPRKDVVWPEAPETPRIRFVQAFKHTDDLDRSAWARFKRALLGGSADPSLAQPMGIALSEDGKRIYVADYGLSRVLVADLEDKRMKVFAPEEQVGKPFGVALDAAENVYITDELGHAVRVFSKAGEPLRLIGANELERPTGIAIDRERKLVYVSDTAHRKSEKHRVRVFDLEGKWLRDLGAKEGEATKGNGPGQWYFPTYIALAPAGTVYVADTMNFRIQVFDPEGKFVRAYGENGDGPGMFARIKGMGFDSFGNLYVADGNHSNVQLFNKDFQVLMFFGGYAKKLEYFDIPSGVAIDPKTNRIYVCNEFIARVNVYELINTKPEDSIAPKEPPKEAKQGGGN
jgi:DNA-binding beta-propeller fold protein YncE